MRMKWLPAGIGLFLVGMSVVSFADERVYEQAEFPHEICGTWTDIHGGRTLEITPLDYTYGYKYNNSCGIVADGDE